MTTTTTSGTTPLAHTFNDQQLRHVILDGERWFLGGDILTILYGGASGKANRYHKLDAAEIRKVHRMDLGMPAGQRVNVISESGLYKLIMRSDKPQAREFQNWVTREVLPSIRKTGGYLLNEDARFTAHADAKQAMPQTRRNPRVGNKPSPLDRGNPATPGQADGESIYKSSLEAPRMRPANVGKAMPRTPQETLHWQ